MCGRHAEGRSPGSSSDQEVLRFLMGVSQNQGYLFGGPHNNDYGILGSILGSPFFWELPYPA